MKPENLVFLRSLLLSPVDLHLHTLTTEYKYDFAQQTFADELKTSIPDPEGGLCDNEFSPVADPAETIYIKCAKVGESWELKMKYNPDSIRRNVLALV